MKIKVFDRSLTEKELSLQAVTGARDGKVSLVAVDAGGRQIDGGYIVSVRPDGIYRHVHVREDLGLPLDSQGRVKLAGEPSDLAAALKLIKPFAEYIKARDTDPVPYPATAVVACCDMPDRRFNVTIGDFLALATFYEANK